MIQVDEDLLAKMCPTKSCPLYKDFTARYQQDPRCSASSPCDEGEGNCHTDSDCAGRLVCGSHNCPQSAPGTSSITNCCARELEKRCQAHQHSQADCCTRWSPCKLGGGDCDSDDECEGSLTCVRDNCRDFWSWADPSWDCCQ